MSMRSALAIGVVLGTCVVVAMVAVSNSSDSSATARDNAPAGAINVATSNGWASTQPPHSDSESEGSHTRARSATETSTTLSRSLIEDAIEELNAGADPEVVASRLRIVLSDRSTTSQTAYAVAELLVSLTRNTGTLEWIAETLAVNIDQRQDESDPLAARATAHQAVQSKLIEEGRVEEALLLSDQAFRALPSSSQLMALRGRVLATRKDYEGAIAIMSAIPNADQGEQIELIQYLYRAGHIDLAKRMARELHGREAQHIAGLEPIVGAQND